MVASRVLAVSGQTGSGNFDKGDPRDLFKFYEFETSLNLPNFIHLPGPAAFAMPTGFRSMNTIAGQILHVVRDFAMTTGTATCALRFHINNAPC